MKRILLCQSVNGAAKPTVDGAALLIGVSREHLLEQWDPASGADSMPTDFKRRGMKRSKHAQDAIGTNTGTVILAFLAMRDWGARIDFDEAAGKQWAVLDEEASGG